VTERSHSIEEFRQGYESENRLRGFASACGFRSATWLLACPRCGQHDLVEVELSGHGTVAAFSVQNVPSDEFLNDAPYAYVVVDLEEGGRITGWIPGIASEAELRIGEAVHFVSGYRPGVQFAKG